MLTIQALPPRQTRVSVLAKAPLALQQRCCFFPRQYITGEQEQRPRGQAPQLPQLRQDQSMPSRHSLSNQRDNSLEDPRHKWVINLSSKPLTQAQRLLLAKGPNYAIAPRHPLNLEYITAIESVCTKLSQQYAGEHRADINWVLRGSHPLNLTLAWQRHRQ